MITIPLLLVLMAADPTSGGVPSFETQTLSGKVVPLGDALKARGIEADPGPIETQVVVEEEDGTLVPLLSDEASRALFTDARLRGRRAEVYGRKYRGLPYLQVLTFKVDEGGTLRTPEYFCEVCAISVRYPQICPCCQGDMVLRMKPEGR